MVMIPMPAAAAAAMADNTHAGMRAHRPHMRAGAHAVGPHAGSHADRADLHASANLRRRYPGGDEARGKKQCGPKLHLQLLSVGRERLAPSGGHLR